MKRILCFVVLCVIPCAVPRADGTAVPNHWQAPFKTISDRTTEPDSLLTLDAVLSLVAENNPTLRALELRRQAAAGAVRQARLWSNPELEGEIEEFGWDAPGLSESEVTLALSQTFELFGQRGARRAIAETELKATDFEADVNAFDLYLEVKRRFYALAHAQEGLRLAAASLELAEDIVENIRFRIRKGAGLRAELLLAQIQQQRALLALEREKQQKRSSEARLAALWGVASSEITVASESEPEFTGLLPDIESLAGRTDSTRAIVQLRNQAALVRAERSLAAAEARPAVTLSGGLKRLEANNSKSFLLGISLPLPLFNRNQGTTAGLDTRLQSLDYEIDRERLDAKAAIESHILKFRNLMQRHEILDSRLLPTAEEAYQSLNNAYESGRLPYTQLLEAERSLNELRFEHNDVLLSLHQQIITLESLTGVTLRPDKER